MRSIKFDTHHLASNVYKSLISQNEVFDIEYLPDKLLINDTLFLQQFMVIWTSTVPTITNLVASSF